MSITDNPRPECTCTSSMDTDPESGGPATPKVDPDCPYHGNSPAAEQARRESVPVDPSLETTAGTSGEDANVGEPYAVAQSPGEALDPDQQASEQDAAEDVDNSISTDTEDTPVSADEERQDERDEERP